MGRSLKRKRAQRVTAPLSPPLSDPTPADSLDIEDLISPSELATTIETLKTLSQNPSLAKQRCLRELRGAVYAFDVAKSNGSTFIPSISTTSSLTARISDAISTGRYTDARVLLAEMRIRGQSPKLGALQRWVRECDAISGKLVKPSTSHDHDTAGLDVGAGNETMLVLEAILRTASPSSFNLQHEIVRMPLWDTRPTSDRYEMYAAVRSDTLMAEDVKREVQSKFRVLQRTPGPDRKPPNLHPADLYRCADDAVQLDCQAATPPAIAAHPVMAAVHLLSDVLSIEECRRIVGACEAVGFKPDAPIASAEGDGSILAHNVYWLVDQAFMQKFQDRVLSLLTTAATAVGISTRPLGLNRRFRVYRYVPGALYRPHIDGAWPPSGEAAPDAVQPQGQYIYDTSDGRQMSKLTLLIYLNDEFAGGETTFFRPAQREGSMEAFGVKPRAGSALVFPHGDAGEALLHEGTGVIGELGTTAKYVIRTDVLFSREKHDTRSRP